MRETTLQQAFNLYVDACPARRRLTRTEGDSFLQLLHQFIESRVRALIQRSDSDYPDFVNECLLQVWTAACRSVLPFDGITRFVEGIKTICRNKCIDLLRARAPQDALKERFVKAPKLRPLPATPDGLCSMQEMIEGRGTVLVLGMLARNRCPDVDEALCRETVQLFLSNKPRSALEKVIRKRPIFRFDFLLRYLPVLYHWAFADLRSDVICMLDEARPTG